MTEACLTLIASAVCNSLPSLPLETYATVACACVCVPPPMAPMLRSTGQGALAQPLPFLLAAAAVALLCLAQPCHSQVLVLPASTLPGPHAALWPQPFLVEFNTSLPNCGPTLYVDPSNFQIVWDNLVQVREPLLTQRQEIRAKLFPLPADPQQDPSLSVTDPLCTPAAGLSLARHCLFR